MNLTGFNFLCFFAVLLVLYYLAPKKIRWSVLLLGSIVYYVLAGNAILILYPVVSIALCYIVSRVLSRENRIINESAEDSSKKKHTLIRLIVMMLGVGALLAVLIILKYTRFTSAEALLVPLGLSYYTFTLIGYLADIYYGMTVPQVNFLRLMGYGMYFPALVSGPILQYRHIEDEFFAEHVFDFTEVTRGMQRMLWGFFKKLVIAERLGVAVATVYNDPLTYGGAYVWLAIFMFTLQLYTDFSGLMDIVIGMSQCFGIKLPENFNTPFFSKSISEYWRRWHITLGVWMKEYVFYPILKTDMHYKLQTKLIKMFGKKRGKQIATFMAMFVLWFAVGLWHGGNMTYVIGSGLLQWFYIICEDSLKAPADRLWKKLGINPNARGLNAFRIIRTFVMVNIGNAFFRSSSVLAAINLFGCGFKIHKLGEVVSGGIFGLGLSWIDMGVVAVSLIILFIVSVLQQKQSVRERIASKPVVVRFIIWYALLFYVILLGQYGPGYSAAEFIYQGF